MALGEGSSVFHTGPVFAQWIAQRDGPDLGVSVGNETIVFFSSQRRGYDCLALGLSFTRDMLDYTLVGRVAQR